METLKTLISATVITYLAWRIVGSFIVVAPHLAWLTPFGAAVQGWSHSETLLWRVAWALGILALVTTHSRNID